MAKMNFDMSNIEATAPREMAPLPEGWYIVQITEETQKLAKSGAGVYLEVVMAVLGTEDKNIPEGNYTKRKLWARFNLWGPDGASARMDKAGEIAREDMKAIGIAVGRPVFSDTAELHGIPFEAYVTIRDGDGKYSPSNETKAYRPYGGAAQAPAPAPAPAQGQFQPGQASAPAAGTPPAWANKLK